MQRYRSGFVGKSSPVCFSCEPFDLNTTRFSGRPCTPPAGAPRYDACFGQFLLPCATVLRTAGLARTVQDFFDDAYRTVAMLADWNRSFLKPS